VFQVSFSFLHLFSFLFFVIKDFKKRKKKKKKNFLGVISP